MSAQRTDPHRPGALVPEHYRHRLSFAYATTRDGVHVPPLHVDAMLAVTAQEGPTPRWRKPSGKGGCDVCGAHFNYGDVFEHVPTRATIVIGWECAEKIQSLDRSAFKRELASEQATALRQREQEARARAAAEFVATTAGLAAALALEHPITRDLAANLRKWGSLTPRQVALALKLHREATAPPRRTVPVPASDARQTVVGRVVSLKEHATNYGTTLRMLVAVATPEGEFRVFGTRPTSIAGVERGDVVTFIARLSRSDKDPAFGFFERPASAAVFQTVNVKEQES